MNSHTLQPDSETSSHVLDSPTSPVSSESTQHPPLQAETSLLFSDAPLTLATHRLETLDLKTPELKTLDLETLNTLGSGRSEHPLLQLFAQVPIPDVPAPQVPVPEDSPGSSPDLLERAGQAPSLRTEPINPNQPPFQPVKIQLKRPSQFVGRSSPAVTIITPSAYGQPFRSLGVGVGIQARTRNSDKADGSFGVGLGLGDAVKAVGLNIGIISFSSFRQGFGEIGTVNFKVNHYFPHGVAIAAGVNNGLTWGGTDSSVSPFGVVTKQFMLRENNTAPLSRLYLSVGVGGGQFRSESDVINRVHSVGVFGSAALRLAEPVTLISEWSGQDLTLGLSVIPFRKVPIVLTPAVTDVTGTAGDGARFILGIGYGFKY